MSFELTDAVQVEKDDRGAVTTIEHIEQPFVAGQNGSSRAFAAGGATATPQAIAEQYLEEVAPIYNIDAGMLPNRERRAFAAGEPAGSSLRLSEEKELMGTSTVSYQQTHAGLPVWQAGVSVTVQEEPLRVTASQSSVHQGITVEKESLTGGKYRPAGITESNLGNLLGLEGKPDLKINGTSELIYQYEPAGRFHSEVGTPNQGLQESPPVLPLPPVPDGIKPGEHYVVSEVLFSLPYEGHGVLNWRAFVEVKSGAVLYLRAFTSCATGMIFRADPHTAGAPPAVTPTSAPAVLNPLRSTVPLTAPGATPQNLSGPFVQVVENNEPAFPPPVGAGPAASFAFDAPAREFAAVNAYHHCDGLFRLMQSMGFDISTYFDGTEFPMPVDATALGDAVNAQAPGNITGTGGGGFRFGLAGGPFPAVGIAADVRVVWHEFGHTLLWDSVHSPNFGFAHSAGDSLAAILMDPESALRTDPVRRFQTFPWVLPDSRNHGREVADGWGWGGVNDTNGYSSEQILSTTHFRLYRSLGGDSNHLPARKRAARQAAYMIFRAIGTLATNPVTPTPMPDVYATALRNADIGTSNFEGYRGGAFHKVIRWSFERQGLFQPAGAPAPVTTPGAPPPVDVYINDGRNGHYEYQPVHWNCTDIINRLSATNGPHQTPVVGRVNFAYVKVKNRGTQQANNVVVRGYSANPGAGLTWPADWKPMLTAQRAVPGGIAPGATVTVGPFRWKPAQVGHECMFMEVSCAADRSNIDPATFFPAAAGPMPEWRLVPFDNNIAQRNVAPVAAGGGLRGLLSSFVGREFVVGNPLGKEARIKVEATLPAFLEKRGWGIKVDSRNDLSFSLAASNKRTVKLALSPGEDFTAEEVRKVKGGAAITVSVLADGSLIGGMTYLLDPTLKKAPVERVKQRPIPLSHPVIEEAIRDARLAASEEDGLDDEAASEGETDSGDSAQSSAVQLLQKLGLNGESRAKIQGVKLTKVTIEIDLEEDDEH